MNIKKVLLIAAFICASPVMNVIASIEEMSRQSSDWIEDLNDTFDCCIESLLLSNSFAAKQAMWFDFDAYLNQVKITLENQLAQWYATSNNDDIFIIKIEAIKAVEKVIAKLDEAVSRIEKQFSIPAGQFKIDATKFVEDQTK